MNAVPVVTKDELIATLTYENAELRKQIHVLEARLEEETKQRHQAEELVAAWKANHAWDCKPSAMRRYSSDSDSQ
jgi:hypothetical protein